MEDLKVRIKDLYNEIKDQCYKLGELIPFNEYTDSYFQIIDLAFDLSRCKYDEEWFDDLIELLQEMKENVVELKKLGEKLNGNN